MRVLGALLVLVLMIAAGNGDAQPAPRKFALVIGNSAYQTLEWRLANPARDATLMAERLRGIGFEVNLVTNATRPAMEAAFDRFGASLKANGPDTVGFFFYAGHGAQKDGVNYLVPVDANARTADRLRFQSPPVQFLLDDMAEAGNAVNIIILDACRDMPLEDGYRAIGRGGLADVGRLPNVFMAYAAAPGRTASDGGAGPNSPFTTALAEALRTHATDPIALLFDDVNSEVFRATQGGQSPEYRNGLVRAPRWSLTTAPQVARPPPQPTPPAPVSFAGPPPELPTLGGMIVDQLPGRIMRGIVAAKIPSGSTLVVSSDYFDAKEFGGAINKGDFTEKLAQNLRAMSGGVVSVSTRGGGRYHLQLALREIGAQGASNWQFYHQLTAEIIDIDAGDIIWSEVIERSCITASAGRTAECGA